jgi:DNA-directed RNA polymerase specialized sigma24 family protein
MDGSVRPSDRSFRFSPVDRLGRRIRPPVLEAAEEIGHRALEHAEKELIDPAVAATLLEEAAATVSRALETKRDRAQNTVRDLPSYLFRAFIRRVNKTKKRQLIYEDAARDRSLDSHTSTNSQRKLELKILIDEVLTACDPVTRDMFYRRIQGFSWKDIGLSYRISSGAAKSRFSQALHRIGERLGLKSGL